METAPAPGRQARARSVSSGSVLRVVVLAALGLFCGWHLHKFQGAGKYHATRVGSVRRLNRSGALHAASLIDMDADLFTSISKPAAEVDSEPADPDASKPSADEEPESADSDVPKRPAEEYPESANEAALSSTPRRILQQYGSADVSEGKDINGEDRRDNDNGDSDGDNNSADGNARRKRRRRRRRRQGKSSSRSIKETSFETNHMRQLVADIRAKAPAHIAERCVSLVRGQSMDSFGVARQDWIAYQTFFRSKRYGEGFYVDVGAHHPVTESQTYFFDACLGWKGLCIEGNPRFAGEYLSNRTCQLIPSCVAPSTGRMKFRDAQGRAVSVRCNRLQGLLASAGVTSSKKIDLAAVSLKGRELPTLRCFPFDAFHAPIWMARVYHRGHKLNSIFGRAGYWASPTLLAPASENGTSLPWLGLPHTTLYVRWPRPEGLQGVSSSSVRHPDEDRKAEGDSPLVPTLVLGPAFRPGKPFFGASFMPSCKKSKQCPPVSIPSIDTDFEFKQGKFLHGQCPSFGNLLHRLSQHSLQVPS